MTKKIVYQFKPFIKVIKENYQNRYESRKDFHQIYLQNSAMVIVQDKDNRVLFLNEYRRGLKKLSLGFPGGNIEKKEKPIQAVKRELLEETKWFNKKQIIQNLNKGKFETSGVLSAVLFYLFKKYD